MFVIWCSLDNSSLMLHFLFPALDYPHLPTIDIIFIFLVPFSLVLPITLSHPSTPLPCRASPHSPFLPNQATPSKFKSISTIGKDKNSCGSRTSSSKSSRSFRRRSLIKNPQVLPSTTCPNPSSQRPQVL
jgi:hypothetical protein